jgi:hypothetical protein
MLNNTYAAIATSMTTAVLGCATSTSKQSLKRAPLQQSGRERMRTNMIPATSALILRLILALMSMLHVTNGSPVKADRFQKCCDENVICA